MRDETLDDKLPRTLAHDILRQTHTTLHSTVYQHTDGTGIREGHIVQRLHKHAQGPHQQRGKNINQADARRVEMHEIGPRQEIHTILGQQHNTQIHQITIHHAHQVHETRVTHKT